MSQSIKETHIDGLAFGYTQFIQNVSLALLFMSGAFFMTVDPTLDAQAVFITIFAILFGAISSGQANQFGPDLGKAAIAAEKVFKISEVPSEINAVDIPKGATKVPHTFAGQIEF